MDMSVNEGDDDNTNNMPGNDPVGDLNSEQNDEIIIDNLDNENIIINVSDNNDIIIENSDNNV
jgi:hypothetical protein